MTLRGFYRIALEHCPRHVSYMPRGSILQLNFTEIKASRARRGANWQPDDSETCTPVCTHTCARARVSVYVNLYDAHIFQRDARRNARVSRQVEASAKTRLHARRSRSSPGSYPGTRLRGRSPDTGVESLRRFGDTAPSLSRSLNAKRGSDNETKSEGCDTSSRRTFVT